MTDTLKLFLANSCNYSLTAKQMFLHPNSVRYRLQTIEKICKINLRSEEDRLSLLIAFKLHPLILAENKINDD
ncbi:helix-turn-helix domain-containing protein [Candidatus Formimonas warabiya]|uniref:PucR family transcriptional regulator n=1 Tax=Formimonas warabiya TaxID=1761012 RepID=UPI001BE49C54